jgi:hypothetical protein
MFVHGYAVKTVAINESRGARMTGNGVQNVRVWAKAEVRDR